jgi:glycosyltransferase involved in cell wall biosynthesis
MTNDVIDMGMQELTQPGERAAAPAGDHGRGTDQPGHSTRVLIIGAGSRFLSGISYYTNRLINVLGQRHRVSAILVRQMMPTWLYPGRARVGKALTHFTYPQGSRVLDGIDWFWGLSIVRAIRLLRQERPHIVVFQWWTGTVLHSYLLMAALARLADARLLIEFHEVLDTAEQEMGLASRYVSTFAPWLFRWADGFIVHNEFDRQALEDHYRLGERPVAMIPHGPYDQYVKADPVPPEDDAVCRLLYFGVIRPFKGVEDIVDALDLMTPEEAARFRLTIVGETWEGWTEPAERIAASRHRDRITFVNRYVDDDEVSSFFAASDVVVLPYHRSSASGPMHLAMASGLPVIVTAVGGLVEAADGYEGAIQIPPRDPEAIRAALQRAYEHRTQRYEDVHSWARTLDRYGQLFAAVTSRRQEAA